MNKILIVSLVYEEPEWREQTKPCIENTGLPVIYVHRDGVGNMARAFNTAVYHSEFPKYEFVWFVTNIIFPSVAPMVLADYLKSNSSCAAVQPSYESDHPHLRPFVGSKTVPFLEFTCPLVRADLFKKNMLDEMLPYYYHDLDWSYRVRGEGWQLACINDLIVSHTYLRNNQSTHPISLIRKQLRDYWTPISKAHMITLYGPNWEKLMRWK